VKLKSIVATFFVMIASLMLPSLAGAQEGEPVVVDEVIAQVNDGIVTLSQVKREMKERVETLKQNGMSEAQAISEVEKKRPELIAILINEQLLLQKGKELDFTQRVEDEVNKRMLQVATENHLKTMDQLCEAMKQSGLSCEQARTTMRTEIMKQAVLESEVDSKMFYGWRDDELHKYFDAHKDKFVKPESVDLSEIFLGLAGKPEADVKAKADQLVPNCAEARISEPWQPRTLSGTPRPRARSVCSVFRTCELISPRQLRTSKWAASVIH